MRDEVKFQTKIIVIKKNDEKKIASSGRTFSI